MPANFTTQTDDGMTANANAYIDVAFFRQYFLDRGRDTTAIVDTAVQTGIVVATDYIDNRWRLRFAGQQLNTPDPITGVPFPQTTEFPRANAYFNSGLAIAGLPLQLKKACAEYALRAATAPLISDGPTPVVDGEKQPLGDITSKHITVGPITTVTQYTTKGGGFGDGTVLVDECLLPKIPAADLLIEALVDSSGIQRRVLRS